VVIGDFEDDHRVTVSRLNGATGSWVTTQLIGYVARSPVPDIWSFPILFRCV